MDAERIAALAGRRIDPQQHLIGGENVPAADRSEIEVLSPRNGEPLTTIAGGTVADVDAAVASARAAFDSGSWADASPAHRKKVLMRGAWRS